jgi:hypothetical protein
MTVQKESKKKKNKLYRCSLCWVCKHVLIIVGTSSGSFERCRFCMARPFAA